MSVNVYENGELKQIAGTGTKMFCADSPVGSIVPYGGTVAPTDWFLCQGQELDRTEYADLFAVIGESFGTPSSITKFKLPDLRGEFLRGAGANGHNGQGNGGTVGQHQDATELPSFELLSSAQSDTSAVLNRTSENADIVVNADSSKDRIGYQLVTTSALVEHPVQNAGDFTTRPTNTSVNYIIKAKQTALPADLQSAAENAGEAAALTAINGAISYSTTETPTGGTWIDGKPIYRKVFSNTITTYEDSNLRRAFRDTLFSDNYVDSVINISGMWNSNNKSLSYNSFGSAAMLPDLRENFASSLSINKETGNTIIHLFTPMNWNATEASYYVTVEYTKTTD